MLLVTAYPPQYAMPNSLLYTWHDTIQNSTWTKKLTGSQLSLAYITRNRNMTSKMKHRKLICIKSGLNLVPWKAVLREQADHGWKDLYNKLLYF